MSCSVLILSTLPVIDLSGRFDLEGVGFDASSCRLFFGGGVLDSDDLQGLLLPEGGVAVACCRLKEEERLVNGIIVVMTPET